MAPRVKKTPKKPTPKRGGSRDKITPAFKKKFLKLLSETGMVNKTCKALNISRQNMYLHKRTHPKFEKEWIAARSHY